MPVLARPTCGALVRQPLRRWGGRRWLVHALAAVSLCPAFMERLLVGMRSSEQGFSATYTGQSAQHTV